MRSAPSSGTATAPNRYCDHCTAAIETGDRYPVTKRRLADGSLAFFSFDDIEACRPARLGDQGEPATEVA